MGIFGPFGTGRLLDSGGGATVYEAKKEGDRKGRYAVKVFSLEHAIEAGRLAFKAGRIGKKLYATASSPIEGVPEWTS